MARVVCDDDLRFAGAIFSREPLLQISNQSLRGAADVEIIHRVRPDAWLFGAVELLRASALRVRDDFSNGAPAQSARAEGECAVEPVVELAPLTGVRQLLNTLRIDGRIALLQHAEDVVGCGVEQFASLGSRLDGRFQVTHRDAPQMQRQFSKRHLSLL